MEYRQLGRSGIAVSAFGLGAMTFGGQTPEDDAFRQLDMAFDAGITLFDTAENYPTPTGPDTQGRSEDVLGRWIAARGVRDRVVVATKVAGPGSAAGDMRHIRGDARRLDRTNIRQAAEDSLRRLRTDHIDLYQVHWAERAISTLGRSRFSLLADTPMQVPIEETLAALSELVTEGKLRAIGVCNESPWGVMQYLAAAAKPGLARIASIQNGYSLLDRSFEVSLGEIACREHVGLIAYSPLARGLLTSRSEPDPAPTPDGQASQSAGYLARLSSGKRRATLAYIEVAREHGIDPAHMALAFAQAQPFMTSVLVAASKTSQLSGNLGAIGVVLEKPLMQAINAIHDGNPNPK